MDANELGRWTRFAAKGGIGRGTAVADCLAEQEDDLMFLQGDEITILMQLPGQDDLYLGYCEGVVGRFNGQDVRFHSKLKKPVMTKRSSTAAFSTAGSSRPSSSLSALTAVTQGGRDSVPLSLPPASPSFPPPSNPSHHRTPSNFSATAESPRPPSLSRPHSSTPPPAQSSLPAPLPAPFLFPQSATHLRSVSYSSISTALDSAPRTPADFSKDFRDSVRVLSFVQDVDSPSEIDADITLSAVDLSIDPAEAISDSHKTSPVLHPESRSPVRSSSQETLNNVEIEPPSFLESEPTARFSRLSANSDGEVGIGLSLLQDFINDAADDSDSVASSRKSVVISPSNTVNYTSKPDADLPVESPTHSQHLLESPTSPASQHDLSTTSQSPVPPVTREAISRNSTQPSVTDSEYGGEDWEGASDIYDNYRYSRLSMASKVSRLSKGSMHTVASAFGLEVPPPVPRDTSRSSLDSQRPIRSRVGSLGENSQPAEGVIVSVDSTVNSAPAVPPLDVKVTTVPPERKKTDEGKHVPSPLTFAPGIISFGTGTTALQTSPLLHTTFASPVGSPSAHSMNAFLSPNPSSPTYPSAIGGIASALRQKIEMERAVSPAAGSQRSVSPSPSALSENQGPPPSINRISTQPIVQDDDGNEGPSTDPPDLQAQERESESPERVSSPESAPPTTAPTSAGSVVVSEKAALESTQVVANPPPPYTPIAVASETQTELHVQATSSSSHQTDPSPPVARPLNPNRSPASPSARQSLFLPHPHAPKPTLSPTGPMYGRAPPPVSPLSPPLTGPLPGSLTHTLSTLYSHRFEQGPFRRTLYGKFDHDLAYSSGPIPISFTLEPPQSIPANRMPPSNRPMHQSTSLPDMLQQSSINGAPTVPSTDSNGFNQVVVGKTIPRANFFPKVQTPRPRSRSFSGFDASGVAPEVAMKERSAEEIHPPSVVPPQPISKRSKSASATVQSSKGGPQRGPMPHKPSPLSLSHNIVVAPHATSPKSPIKSSPSPLSRPPIIASQKSVPPDEQKLQQKTPPSPESRTFQHKHSASQTTLPASPKSDVPPSPLATNIPTVAYPSPQPELSQSPPLRSSPEAIRIPSRSPPVIRHSRSSLSGKRYSGRETSPSRSSIQGRRSGETDSDGQSVTSPPLLGSPPSSGHLGRSGSLRSKLSLPTLRIRNSERSFQYDGLSPTLSIPPSENDLRMVQIQDTDFELVKPVVVSSPKEDSFPPPSPINPDSSLRVGSPALSLLSGSNTALARTPPSPPVTQTSSVPTKPLDTADVEAHRQRELRWISTMASVPPSQSRKTKKIRRLLQEGVPASVRYLVWAHLTDSKSKRMDGLYAKLGKRERVSAVANIERDAKRCFVDKPELQDGSLVNLLQAYLTMVPDIQYSRGLTAIAGCLLMQSPEEDAFWTFISLMDTHLRPYFSSSAIQLEVDGSLFGRALEANEPALVKKVFIDMALSPVMICRPWFSSLFVDVLPIDYLHRVWDIFLFEGVGFLFRVGLAIFTSCKQAIMTTNGRDAVFDILMHPPLTSLPDTPDALIDLALSVKLKEGDLQKQRAKMEAQLKRSTQSTRGLLPQSGRVSVSTPAISLPKS